MHLALMPRDIDFGRYTKATLEAVERGSDWAQDAYPKQTAITEQQAMRRRNVALEMCMH